MSDAGAVLRNFDLVISITGIDNITETPQQCRLSSLTTCAPRGGGGGRRDESSQTGGKLRGCGRGRRWATLLFHLPLHVNHPPAPGTRHHKHHKGPISPKRVSGWSPHTPYS